MVQAVLLQEPRQHRHRGVALRNFQQRSERRQQHVVILCFEQKEEHLDVGASALVELGKYRKCVRILGQVEHNSGEVDQLLALGQMSLLPSNALKQFKYLAERSLVARERRRDGIGTHEGAQDLQRADLVVVAGRVVADFSPRAEALV